MLQFWLATAHGQANWGLVPGVEIYTGNEDVWSMTTGHFLPGEGDQVVWFTRNRDALVFDERPRPRVLVATTPLAEPDDGELLAADLDGDGLDDLVTFRNGMVGVFLADGAGGFVLSDSLSSELVFELVAGDVDADGDVDLVPQLDTRPFLGDGDGHFTNVPLNCQYLPASYAEHVLVDVTGDGWLDYVGVGEAGGVVVLPFDGVSFACATEEHPVPGLGATARLSVGDLTGDGVDDVALVQADDLGALWLHVFARGGGVLQPLPAQGAAALLFTVADLDGDGDDDLLYDGVDRLVVQLQHEGALLPETSFWVPQGVAARPIVAELSGDGCPDVARLSANRYTLVLGACAGNDADEDGLPDPADPCPFVADSNPDDDDADGVPDACDTCLTGYHNLFSWLDYDLDGRTDLCDVCPGVADDGADADADGFGDACDNCPTLRDGFLQRDEDEDGLGDVCDPCPSSPDNTDRDGDGVGDVCDGCPDFASTENQSRDGDRDGVADACDVCPEVVDDQEDLDGDGIGDACDSCPDATGGLDDLDGDGVGTECDVCPGTPDDQTDADQDGVGDACDLVDVAPEAGCGCASSPARGTIWLFAAALLVAQRRSGRPASARVCRSAQHGRERSDCRARWWQ